jgi:hypothetical protein
MVKDIYFLNESMETQLDTGHINFKKMYMISDRAAEFLIVKDYEVCGRFCWLSIRPFVLKHPRSESCCVFLLVVLQEKHEKDTVVQRYFKTAYVFSEKELFQASVACEPPEKKDNGRTMQRLKYVLSSIEVFARYPWTEISHLLLPCRVLQDAHTSA